MRRSVATIFITNRVHVAIDFFSILPSHCINRLDTFDQLNNKALKFRSLDYHLCACNRYIVATYYQISGF